MSFVGLRCPMAILEARERARKNRPIGLARDQSERVHAECVYDLSLDTSALSVEACAVRILALFDAAEWPAQAAMAPRPKAG